MILSSVSAFCILQLPKEEESAQYQERAGGRRAQPQDEIKRWTCYRASSFSLGHFKTLGRWIEVKRALLPSVLGSRVGIIIIVDDFLNEIVAHAQQEREQPSGWHSSGPKNFERGGHERDQ